MTGWIDSSRFVEHFGQNLALDCPPAAAPADSLDPPKVVIGSKQLRKVFQASNMDASEMAAETRRASLVRYHVLFPVERKVADDHVNAVPGSITRYSKW